MLKFAIQDLWDASTLKKKFLAHQQGTTYAEIRNSGPMGCIRLKKKKFLAHQQGATCAEIGTSGPMGGIGNTFVLTEGHGLHLHDGRNSPSVQKFCASGGRRPTIPPTEWV